MRRIVVVGSSCSGKTTLARRLAGALGVPHVELDALFWLPNWQERENAQFLEHVERATAGDGWVVDGNYKQTRAMVWPRADTIVWLNYSFATVLGRCLWRTIGRSATGTEVFSGNRETFTKAFFSRESIILWVLQTFHRRRREYRALLDGEAWPHLRVVELRSAREAEAFLASLPRS
jgi:adenylate kinase family enzyme